jgi:3-deoxy-manno-octulosonate cytidylyltransferase (CMP-KDO synthetase)
MSNILNYLLVIPARYKSIRLPGKPLIDLNGYPMIIRTCLQCAKVVPKNKIIVATDDNRIAITCKKYGFNYKLTKSNCLTGTDRVLEIAKKIKSKYYINVQGDEPIFNPADINIILKKILKKHKNVLLGYTKIKNKEDILSANIPKIFFDRNKKLIFATRKNFNYDKKTSFYRQVLIYSYPREKILLLKKFKKKKYFESKEDIEILRFLESGINVDMVKMSDKSKSIDIKKDIKKVLKLI